MGQAHHDSYYPQDWLKVRWLCGKHHKAWHLKNEPKWPTIFEFHPSDRELTQWQKLTDSASGRPPSPWYWKSRNRWYVTVNGKRHNLGPDYDAAVKKFRKLLV